jgi:CheY-like chemotaxis protein
MHERSAPAARVENDLGLSRPDRDHALLTWDQPSAELRRHDGLEAIRLIDIAPPDAVVLDLGLPHVDGCAVRQELAAHAHRRSILAIVATNRPGNHSQLDVACA